MPKTNSKRNQSKQDLGGDDLDLLKFFKIELKTDKQLGHLNGRQKRQYLCRLKRWDSCLETELDFHIWRTREMFNHNNLLRDVMRDAIEEIKSNPHLEEDFQEKNGKSIQEFEEDIEMSMETLGPHRKDFIQLCIEVNENKAKQIEVSDEESGEEIDDEVEDINTDDEFYESHDKKVEIEIKDEKDFKLKLKKELKEEVKMEVKHEIKSEFKKEYKDIKPYVKKEVKNEMKEEIKAEVKEEIISDSDDWSD